MNVPTAATPVFVDERRRVAFAGLPPNMLVVLCMPRVIPLLSILAMSLQIRVVQDTKAGTDNRGFLQGYKYLV